MDTEDVDALSSDSEDDTGEEQKLSGDIQKLILEAEANPYQYDKHIELITALRASGDLDQLRSARENMAAVYPLAEELWLEWFEDELPLAIIAEHKEYLISKFELAVKDYASTKIWQEYCQFLMNNIESPSDIDRARETFERAITAVGLHVTEGSCIWDGYREFEMAILDSYQQLQDSGDTVGMDEKVRLQIEKIASLFKRQLSIPLIGITDAFAAFENWSSEAIPDETQRGYEKASQKLNSFLEYEEKLQSSQTTGKLPEYYEYINFEIKDGDPARIQSLYERAIKDNCLQHELWENYTQYLDSKLKIHSIALSVHERAVRNCPWISKLWQNYLKSMERNNKEYEKVRDVFEQSLKGGFADSKSYLDIWLLNMDYHRRRVTNWHAEDEKVIELHKVFEDAVTYMNRSFGLEGDKYCVLLREMALIEAKYLHNVNRAQELWDTVMKKHSRDTNMWLEYISFLMLYSDETAIRRVFQRAVQISFEQPEIICDAFIKYERQYGSLQTLDDAQIKVDVQIQKTKDRRVKELDRQNQNETSEKRHEKKGKDKYKFLPDDKKRKKQKHEKQNHRRDIKRAADLDGFKEPLPSKKARVNNQAQENLSESDDRPGSGGVVEIPVEIVSSSTMEDKLQKKTNLEIPTKTNGESTNKTPSITAEPVPMSVASTLHDIEMEVTENSDEGKGKIEDEPAKPDTVDNERSVFLSNMLFTVEESHIRDLFQKCGEISTVRIVLNRAGKSKGFAYLEFKDKLLFQSSMEKGLLPDDWGESNMVSVSVEKALALDRESLLGRPVFVSRCVDKKENPTKFKFPTTLDKRTLYVTNIPFEITTEELTKVFVECGKLKQVRIVTNRSGKSKGFAYVEYENESDAASAVVKVDKRVINNRPINVALSNPPARKVKVADGSADAAKSRPQEQPGSRARSKTQISLLPRTLQKSTLQSTAKPSEPVSVNNQPSSASKKSDIAASNAQEKSTMSNSDFRKFLLK